MKTHLSERCENTHLVHHVYFRDPKRCLLNTSPFQQCSHYSSQCLILTSTLPFPSHLVCVCVCVCVCEKERACSDALWQQDTSCSYYRHPRGRQTHLNSTSHSLHPYNTHTQIEETARKWHIMAVKHELPHTANLYISQHWTRLRGF